MATGNDGVYPVVSPIGESGIERLAPSRPLSGLRGKTICELWDHIFKGDEIFAITEKVLAEKYPGVRFVGYERFGDTHGSNEADVISRLGERLRAEGCDAVISAVGN